MRAYETKRTWLRSSADTLQVVLDSMPVAAAALSFKFSDGMSREAYDSGYFVCASHKLLTFSNVYALLLAFIGIAFPLMCILSISCLI